MVVSLATDAGHRDWSLADFGTVLAQQKASARVLYLRASNSRRFTGCTQMIWFKLFWLRCGESERGLPAFVLRLI